MASSVVRVAARRAATWWRDLPHPRAELVDGEVAQAGACAGVAARRPARRGRATSSETKRSTTVTSLSVAGLDHEARERRDAVDARGARPRSGSSTTTPGGTRTTIGVGERGVELGEDVGRPRPVDRAERASASASHRGAHIDAARQRRRSTHGRPPRRGANVVEVELADAAVAPDLLLGRRQGRREALGCGGRGGAQPGRTVEGRRRVGGVKAVLQWRSALAAEEPLPDRAAACSASTSARISGPTALTMSSASSSTAAAEPSSRPGGSAGSAGDQRAVGPVHVGQPALVARAGVGATPGRVGGEVEVALPDGLAVGVGAALEVLALLAHRHAAYHESGLRGVASPVSRRALHLQLDEPAPLDRVLHRRACG